ncbi:MAG: hypothetical protein BYD32DRAFT_416204 [Podila humilis]|nr:MAG: hypothetical protein BYD32DRAFT_416204 [Podila humilis]
MNAWLPQASLFLLPNPLWSRIGRVFVLSNKHCKIIRGTARLIIEGLSWGHDTGGILTHRALRVATATKGRRNRNSALHGPAIGVKCECSFTQHH